MKNKEDIEVLVLRVGDKYLKLPVKLRVKIGHILTGDIILKDKKSDEYN